VTADPRLYPPRVRILYEDSRAVTRGFGLHDFVLANTRDVIVGRGREIEPYRLAKLIEAIPKKSDTKVLSALEPVALSGSAHSCDGAMLAASLSAAGLSQRISFRTRSVGIPALLTRDDPLHGFA